MAKNTHKSIAFTPAEAEEFAGVLSADNFSEAVKELMRRGAGRVKVPEKGIVILMGEPSKSCPTGFEIQAYGLQQVKPREWERGMYLAEQAYRNRRHGIAGEVAANAGS